jgi:hypothetical protein
MEKKKKKNCSQCNCSANSEHSRGLESTGKKAKKDQSAAAKLLLCKIN